MPPTWPRWSLHLEQPYSPQGCCKPDECDHPSYWNETETLGNLTPKVNINLWGERASNCAILRTNSHRCILDLFVSPLMGWKYLDTKRNVKLVLQHTYTKMYMRHRKQKNTYSYKSEPVFWAKGFNYQEIWQVFSEIWGFNLAWVKISLQKSVM